jgi:hypothetical protein
MLKDYEIVEKFKKGATIAGLTDNIYYQEKADNALRQKKERVRVNRIEIKRIVENAIYQDVMRNKV